MSAQNIINSVESNQNLSEQEYEYPFDLLSSESISDKFQYCGKKGYPEYSMNICDWCLQFDDIEMSFQTSFSKLELNFSETLSNLKEAQDKKLIELRKFHKALCREKEVLQREKDSWKREQDRVQSIVKLDEIVHLNVGGTHNISTGLNVLQSVQNSGLSAMFSGRHNLPTTEENEKRIFVDRDGEIFQEVINYLRNSKETMPEFQSEKMAKQFSQELDFWGIETFEEQQDRVLINLFPKSIREIFNQEPRVSEEMKAIWKEIGPLNLATVYRNCQNDTIGVNMQIDFQAKVKCGGITNNGNSFEGQVTIDGKPQGLYRFINKDPETIFEGQWLNQGSHGYGRIIWKEGNYYIGHWKDAKLNGYGKYVSKDSCIVREGQWKDDIFIEDRSQY